MDIDMIRGDTLNIQFEIECSTEIELSSDDFQVTFSCKQFATDSTYIFQKDKTAVTQVGYNKFVLRLAPEDTQELNAGYYYYDLQLNIGDDVYTIALGKLQLIRDITLPPAVLPEFVYPDVNGDGTVNSSDAVLILSAYSNIQTGEPSGLTPEQENLADANRDGVINSTDASLVLTFYSKCATGQYENNAAGWTEFMTERYERSQG